jgi:halogenation protein CepH
MHDLIVVGGGPGGATVATFVAMQGHKVLLLEKERFPVHKIGESLLPSTVNGICAMLGVSEKLASAHFVRKLGGTFRWGRQQEPWTIAFAMSPKLTGPTAFAYQVERMKFDSILLDNAREKGVDVREQHSVTGLLCDGNGRVTGVNYCNSQEREQEVVGRFVVDASGWSTILHRQVGERVQSECFRNVAVFGYYQHGKRLPPPNAGNIYSVAFECGWFWYIPLSPELTSVGVVLGQEQAHVLRHGAEPVLSQMVARCEPIRDLLNQAVRVTAGPYGQVRVRKDFSYCSTRFWSPGMALVGDAACFIDPVFSSGVHLATYAGLLAARSINTCLADRLSEELAFTEFERRYRREYRYFYDFLVAFYNMDQDVESYYWSARRVLSSEAPAQEAFIELIAGIGGSGEKLYGNTESFLHRQHKLTNDLFYPTGDAQRPVQFGQTQASKVFMAGLLQESAQLQQQAKLKDAGGCEAPLFGGGLVTSADGFHWATQNEPTT